MLDAFFVETFSSFTNSTAFLVICSLILLGGSSSVSVISAKLDASLLSYSGGSTIIDVEGSQLSFKGFFGSFLFDVNGTHGAFCLWHIQYYH